MPERTPSQTVGPFLHIGLTQGAYGAREIFSATVAEAGMPGTRIRIVGRIIDGEGNIVPDALVEIWQADHQARYAHPADGRALSSNSFRGFGRCPTDKDGGFAFDTVKPGSVPGHGGTKQAPHINVGVLSRGLLKRLFTRIYFAGEPANSADPILALVPADRRDTSSPRPMRLTRPLPLRHPPAGRQRDGVLRRVRWMLAAGYLPILPTHPARAAHAKHARATI
jgi:protocatechuate 3,4-dioxygenase alpha subunit